MRMPGLLIPFTLLGACASTPPDPTFSVPAGEYARAFDAAKQVVREAEFELARIDAQEGVIASRPRVSSGFATPWIRHGSGLNDDIEGFAHHQQRSVRITFEPASQTGSSGETGIAPDARAARADGSAQAAATLATPDLRELDGAMTARVEVVLDRIYRPGRRPDATSARLTSFAIDPDLIERDLQPLFTTERRRDDALAGRIAKKISTYLQRPMSDPKHDSTATEATGSH